MAALLRHGHRQDGRRLRRAERVSAARTAARLAGGRVPRAGLEHEGDAPADRDERDLSAVEPGDAGASRARDPENRLFARASRFRMPSLLLRDWALASSGLLDAAIGGAPGLSVSAR